jgi:hypothetical protein
MLSSTTAQRLLPYASGEISTILFRASEEFSNHIINQPDSKAILAKWPSLSSDSACTLASSITDPDLLDTILIKERRKTVLRMIANNKALSLVSRAFLYQTSLITQDSDLRSYVLKEMPAKYFVEMVTNDQLVRSSTNNSLTLQKISEAEDVNLTIKFLETQEPNYLLQLITYNVGLVLKVGKKMNFDFSGKEFRVNRYGNRSNDKPISAKEVKELYHLVNNPRYDEFFIDLLGGDIDILSTISEKLVITALKNLHTYGAKEVQICEDLGILEHLANNSQPDDETAAELLLTKIDPAKAGKTILEHPNQELAIKWALKDFDSFLKMEKINTRSLNSFIVRNIKELGLEKFWQLYKLTGEKDISANFYDHVLREGYSEKSFVASIPNDLLEKLMSLPSEFDFISFLDRVSHELSYDRRRISIAVVMDSMGRSYSRSQLKEQETDVKAIKMLHADGHKDFLLELLNKGRLSEEATTLIGEYIRSDKEMLAKACSILNNSRNNDLIVSLVDMIAPPNGWSSLTRSPDVAHAAYLYLESQLKEDISAWETALTLFDDWTGNLPALASAAKTI